MTLTKKEIETIIEAKAKNLVMSKLSDHAKRKFLTDFVNDVIEKKKSAKEREQNALKPGGGGILSVDGLVMRETKDKKKVLVYNGLFWRTVRVWEIDGTPTGIASPTYQVHNKNFTRFVKRLEELAKATAALQELMKKEVWPLSGEMKAARLQNPSREQSLLKNRLRKEKIEFEERYKFALDVLIHEEHGSPYFNLEFYPRSGKETALFRRFVIAYLNFKGRYRLNIQGPNSGTRTIKTEHLRLAEKMRRKGKGTKAGSLDTITETIMAELGYPVRTPEGLKCYDDKIYANIYRALTRHFRRSKKPLN